MAEIALLNWSITNATLTSTSSGKRVYRSLSEHVRHPWFALLFVVVAQVIVCNLILIRAALQRRCYGPPSYTNYFIVSMATADLIVGTLVMPSGVVSLMCGMWMFDRLWCDLWQTFDFYACTVSIFNLCAISIDRYWAVRHPFRHQRWIRSKALWHSVLLLWLLAALITFPPLIVRQIWFPGDASFRCSNMFRQRVYVLFSSLITFFVPLLAMSIFNHRIHQIARRKHLNIVSKSIPMHRTRLVDSSDFPFPSAEVTTLDDGVADLTTKQHYYKRSLFYSPACLRHHRRPTWRSNRPYHKWKLFSGNIKATQTLAIVTGVFVICWLPYYTLVTVQALWPHLPITTSKVVPVTLWLGWCNSAINPIIYTCLSRSFRSMLLHNLFACDWLR